MTLEVVQCQRERHMPLALCDTERTDGVDWGFLKDLGQTPGARITVKGSEEVGTLASFNPLLEKWYVEIDGSGARKLLGWQDVLGDVHCENAAQGDEEHPKKRGRQSIYTPSQQRWTPHPALIQSNRKPACLV